MSTLSPVDFSAESAEAFLSTTIASALPVPGHWSFDQLDWDVTQASVFGYELDDRFAALADDLELDDLTQLPTITPKWYRAMELLPGVSHDEHGRRVYRARTGELRAQLVAQDVDGTPRIVSLALAVAEREDHWQWFEMTPRAARPATQSSVHHLLPLPADAQRNCGRFAEDGRIMMEFVSIDTEADKLLNRWRQRGWDLRPSGYGGSAQFSYYCSRGEDFVYAWSADTPSQITSLMLVNGAADLTSTELASVP